MSTRGSKLDSYPVEWLLQAIRDWLFEDYRCNRSGTYAQKLLENAANRQNEEAKWLLKRLTLNGTKCIPDFGATGSDYRNKMAWLRVCFYLSENNDPWNNYYYGMSHLENPPFELIEKSAKSEYPPAMRAYGRLLFLRNWAEGEDLAVFWFKKASVLGDAASSCELSWRYEGIDENVAEQYYRIAVQQGSSCAMRERFPSLLGRAIALSGMYAKHEENRVLTYTVQDRFAFGRELQGADEFSDVLSKFQLDMLMCITLYTSVTEKARTAALHAILALRRRLSKDVAVMIGKLVYDTRNVDADAWRHLKKKQKV